MSKILRFIKEGFLGVFRHFALAFSSMSSMTVTLLLMSVFLLLSQNINQITKQIEENVSIYVQIEDETDTETITKLQSDIEKITGVQEVIFSDKHDELEYFIKARGEEAEEVFGGFRGEDNPFYDTFIINLKPNSDIKIVAQAIESKEHIYKVSYGGEATQKLMDIMSQVRNVGFIFVVALSFIAVFLISNTIGATIHSRSEEISIMRTVGATNWYIRWPFIIEGIIIGILGSIIPVAITLWGYTKLYATQGLSIDSLFTMINPNPLIWQVTGIIVLAGAVIGALGSLISVSRRLRWTR